MGGAEHQGGGDEASQSNVFCDSDQLLGFLLARLQALLLLIINY